ncbi:hypothetical protein LSH36_397g00009, partial [Paralvinella palmiformis]
RAAVSRLVIAGTEARERKHCFDHFIVILRSEQLIDYVGSGSRQPFESYRSEIFSTVKKHPSLVPLVFAIGLGAAFASCYLVRLATFNIDTSWRKSTCPHPWQKYKQTDKFKMMTVSIDYSKNEFPEERPNI